MTEALDRFRLGRTSDMNERVERALRELDAAGAAINMSRIAARAGVSRQWLYNSGYREEIERLRSLHSRPVRRARPARESASYDSLRSQNDALRERCRGLKAENDRLQHELQRALGRGRET